MGPSILAPLRFLLLILKFLRDLSRAILSFQHKSNVEGTSGAEIPVMNPTSNPRVPVMIPKP